MTTALCLQCGETKFGAFCPCNSCNAPATGNHNLDIAFSDHRMSVDYLQQLGDVISVIGDACEDSDVRFWTFISYVSTNHPELLSATPPPELRDHVNQLLSSTQLPVVDLQLKEIPPDNGPAMKTVAIPKSLLYRYSAANDFYAIASVQVRDQNGGIHAATLMDDNETILVCREDSPLTTETISAIRKAPGCLTGWLVKPKWIENAE